MSTLDLLTPVEAQHAAKSGWQLAHIADGRTGRLSVQILPLQFGGKFPNCEAVARHVIAVAQYGDPVARRALALVVGSKQPKK